MEDVTQKLYARQSVQIDEEYYARIMANKSLVDFATYTNPDYYPEPFHESVMDTLMQAVEGGCTRIMLFAPPQHGKSWAASVNLPAYWMGKNPSKPIIATSYGAKLAKDHTEDARKIVTSPQWANIFDETISDILIPRIQQGWTNKQVAQERLRIQKQLAYKIRFAGTGGPITGFGAGLGIIDDPIKDYEESMSMLIRDKAWNWYRKVFRTRIWEGGVIILICTRWHDDDLAGRILNSAEENNKQWKILHYSAIATSQKERDDYYSKYYSPMVGVPDPLNRAEGEPLAPGRYSLPALLDLKSDVGTGAWEAEYQGFPRPMDGKRVKVAWFKYADEYPKEKVRYFRYWDKAGTEDDGARSAGVLMTMTPDGIRYIVDVIKGQWSPFKREEIIKDTCIQDKATYGFVETWIEQEPGSGGKESALSTVKNLDGYHIRRDPPSGDKFQRFEPFAVQLEAGNIFIIRGAWNREYTDELLAFGEGAKFKDQADATSGCFKVSKNQGWSR